MRIRFPWKRKKKARGRRVQDGLIRLYSPEEFIRHVTRDRQDPMDEADSNLLQMIKEGLVGAGIYTDGKMRIWWTDKGRAATS